MKPNKPIEDQDLDALLNVHYLNELSEEDRLVMAQIVFAKEYAVEIDQRREKQLLKKLGGPGAGGIKWGIIIGSLAFFALVIIGLKMVWPSEKQGNKNQAIVSDSTQIFTQEKHSSEPMSDPPEDPQKWKYQQEKTQLENTTDLPITLTAEDLTSILEQSYASDEATEEPQFYSGDASSDQPTAKPALFSEAAFVYYKQLKISMIEKLLAYDDRLYTEVDAGIVNYKKKRLNVEGFVMRNISVTNMEYKVFLTDLIAKRNTKGLELALPNRNGWMHYECKGLDQSYFEDHRYDGFPVVNLSPDAMVLFCKWLEQEVNAYQLKTNARSKPFKIRLPYTYEWIHSAYAGFAQVADCPGYYTIFSLSEGLVNKAFVKRVEKNRRKGQKQNNSMDTLLGINRYGMPEGEILKIFEKVLPDFASDGGFQEYPDGLIDIGKAAHVSELNQDETGALSVVVGCWKSKEEYSGMLREFKTLSGSPFVGFRFVIDDGRPRNYIDPLWR